MRRIRKIRFSPHGFLHRPRLGNPMFASRSRRSGPGTMAWLKVTLITLAAAGASAGLVWLIWFCPELQIRTIEVNADGRTAQSDGPAQEAVGTEPAAEPEISAPIRAIINEQMAARRFGIFPQSNIIFFDSRGAKDRISASFYLQELDVNRELPDTVAVTIKERTVRAATVSDGKLWALDDSGFAVRTLYVREMRELPDLPESHRALTVPDAAATEVLLPDGSSRDGRQEENVYPLLINSDSSVGRRSLKPGEQAFPTSVMNLVLAADSRLTDICQDRVKWFDVRDSFETVEAAVGGGWRVIMSSSLPFDAQAERLARLLKGQLAGDRSKLDYIDLRWGERVFIKDKETQPPTEDGQ